LSKKRAATLRAQVSDLADLINRILKADAEAEALGLVSSAD
jgi:hypothetical protein